MTDIPDLVRVSVVAPVMDTSRIVFHVYYVDNIIYFVYYRIRRNYFMYSTRGEPSIITVSHEQMQ